MTGEEFEYWFPGFCNRFTAIANQLAQDDTIAEDWFDALSKYDADKVQGATKQLMAQNPQPFPSEYLGTLIGLIEDDKPRNSRRWSTEREESYKCPGCRDKGLLLVYDDRSIEMAKAGELEPHQVSEMNVACDCEAGEKKFKGDSPPPRLPRYSEKAFCACTHVGNQEKFDELSQWIQEQAV